MYVYDTINTTMVVVFILYFCIRYFDIVIRLEPPMSEKTGKESQSSLSRPSGCDKFNINTIIILILFIIYYHVNLTLIELD